MDICVRDARFRHSDGLFVHGHECDRSKKEQCQPCDTTVVPRARERFLLGSATFAILALELTLIRWMSQQIRVFAYLNNVLLMAAFLGMGLGVAAGKRWPALVHAALPLLLALSAVLCYSQAFGLTFLSFPDVSVALWGAEGLRADERFAINVALILILFVATCAVFLCAGSAVGDLFQRLPALNAYSADLLGSLLGVIAVAALSALRSPPPVWLFVSCLPFLWLSRRWWTYVSAAGIVIFGALSIQGARFSPYYRIDLHSVNNAAEKWTLDVNRDHHQHIIDASSRQTGPSADSARALYDVPFRLTHAKGDALVVGAGTGNDVAAALRGGFHHVVAVEIDSVILDIGRKLHPEHPYADPRVAAVTNDARNYFERAGSASFDVVCFGLLDSHTMLASMSTLRLDNYVYTVEALRSAWARVRPGGVMTISFGIFHTRFIADRMMQNLRLATGQEPLAVDYPNGGARLFVVGRGTQIASLLPNAIRGGPPMRPSTDDWPFLYIRPGVFPSGYIAVLLGIAIITVAGAALVFGRSLFTAARFDPALFLLGAAFLLIETRGVTELSLLFGSTWLVNAAVFGAVLAVAWISNAIVSRRAIPLGVAFVLLFAALAANYAITPATLLGMPMFSGGLAGALLNALPVGFAGILFSTLLSRSPDPTGSLGSNLLGAIAGGLLEYLSLLTGLRQLILVAIALYTGALIVAYRRNRLTVAFASGTPSSIVAPK